MPKTIADASVVVKWIFPEQDSDLAMLLKESGTNFIAPDFLVLECVKSIKTRLRTGKIIPSEADAAIAELKAILEENPGIELVPAFGCARRALEMSHILGCPVPDFFYLALAEKSGGVMVTADVKLAERLQGSEWEQYARLLADDGGEIAE